MELIVSRYTKKIVTLLIFVAILGILFYLFRSDIIYKVVCVNHNESTTSITKLSNVDAIKNTSGYIKENYLILTDPSETQSKLEKENIEQTLSYMKKSFTEKISASDDINYGSYTTVIFTGSDLAKISTLNQLLQYVKTGGKVLFANCLDASSTFKSVAHLFGIYQYGDYKIANGIKLTDNILIQGSGVKITENFIQNYIDQVKIDSTCKTYAETTDGVPLIWSVASGNGTFMMCNGTMFDRKECRGLIVGSLALMNDTFIYPVMNFKLMYIDDFPSPIPGGYNKAIKQRYGFDIGGFYRDIWWPDMVKAAKSYNLHYNGMVIETYDNNVSSNFGANAGSKSDFVMYGLELLKQGGELGLHGYNHQPLALEGFIKENLGYTPWPNTASMTSSLGQLNSYIKQSFPNYKLQCYVPPSNILSPDGRAALIKSFPDLKVISSTYNEDISGDQYVQEFEKNGAIAEMPRITSGYFYDQETNWDILNSVSSIGVFSHFVHPDDVLDTERSRGKYWDDLYNNYCEMLSSTNSRYPWLRSMTASEAAKDMSAYLDSNNYYVMRGNIMMGYCDGFSGSMTYILRTSKNVTAVKDCNVLAIDKNVYEITASSNKFEVRIS